MPPASGADALAALVANFLCGAFPPVDFLAVCLVRAIVDGGGNDCVGNTALPLVFSCAEMHAAHVGFRRFGKSGARNRYYCIVTIHV